MDQSLITPAKSGEKKGRGRKILLLVGHIHSGSGAIAAVLRTNAVVLNAGERIISPADAAELQADCILVLGAGVQDDESPV